MGRRKYIIEVDVDKNIKDAPDKFVIEDESTSKLLDSALKD